jgi:hypothetical protein
VAQTRHLVTVYPQAGDSLSGFIQRVCHASFIPKQAWLWSLLNEGALTKCRNWLELASSAPALARLSKLLGLGEMGLSQFALRKYDTAHEPAYRQLEEFWPEHSLAISTQPICASCLAEGLLPQHQWNYVHAPVCTKHGVVLLEACPACHKTLSPADMTYTHCEYCGLDLRTIKPPLCAPEACAAAALVQSGRTPIFGSASHTEPLSQEDLFKLTRLLLMPMLGEKVDASLTGRMDRWSIDRRVNALAGIGASLVGRRIDSAFVRKAAMPRWAIYYGLPDSLRDERLDEACATLELMPELSNLVLHDDPRPITRTAAETLVNRLPQLHSVAQLGTFLSLSAYETSKALELFPYPTLPSSKKGYDMDFVLAFQRWLGRWMTWKDVDIVLGFEGVSRALAQAGALSAVRRDDDEQPGVCADSVACLLDRIYSLATPSPPEHTIELGQAVSQKALDLAQLTFLFATLMNSGISVAHWSIGRDISHVQVSREEFDRLPFPGLTGARGEP